MHDPREKLVLTARLQLALQTLRQRGSITDQQMHERAAEIERAQHGLVKALGPVDLRELLDTCDAMGLGVDLGVLRQGLRAEQLEAIATVRRRAEAQGAATFDLSSFSAGLTAVPVRGYDWGARLAAWARLEALLASAEGGRQTVTAACQAFHAPPARPEHVNLPGAMPLPAGLPVRIRTLVPYLVSVRAMTSDEGSPCLQDVRAVEAALARDRNDFAVAGTDTGFAHFDARRYLVASDGALRGLQALAALERCPVDLAPAIVQWCGPLFAELVEAWWNNRSGDAVQDREHRANLIYARTGLDPLGAPDEWQHWLIAQKAADRAQQLQLQERMNADRAWCGLALMLGAVDVLGDRVSERWWPLVERLRAVRAPRLAPAPVVAPVAAAVVQAGPAGPPWAAPPDARPAEEPLLDFDLTLPEDDAEFASAPQARASDEDDLVASESTWSIYFKPFLSENWLGLVGVTSLMAAWMFLTMWLWDKGQGYRIGMGALPLLGLTLGAAWVSRYIERLSEGSPRAAELFAALALLSVPFNFALGASLLGLNTPVAQGAGAVLGAVYLLVTPWVGKRLASAFGHNPWRYLIEINLLAYAPSVALLVAGEAALAVTLTAMLFVSFAALLGGLQRAREQAAMGRYTWLLFAGVYLLVNAIPHVYFRQLPPLGGIAILAQLLALAIAAFGLRSAAAVITGAAVSLLGSALALAEPALLPVVLLLGAGYWIDQRRFLTAPYTGEAAALHLLAVGLAVAWHAEAGPGVMLYVAPALVAITLLEKRGAIAALHWALPAGLLAAAAGVRLAPDQTVAAANVAVLLALGIWGHLRYSHAFRTVQYFINFALLLVAVFLSLFLESDAWTLLSASAAALYCSAMALAWGVGGVFLRDPLTLAHRTTLLWIASAVATVATLYAIAVLPVLATPLLAVAAALTLAALGLAVLRSESVLPVTCALALAGAVAAKIKMELGTPSSGLGPVVAAVVLLGGAEWLMRYPQFETRGRAADRFFQRAFPGARAGYISAPFEWAGVLLALFGVGGALMRVAPADAAPATALALILGTVALARIAWRRRWVWMGYLAQAPLVGLLCMLTLTLPRELRPHAILIWIALGFLARPILAARGEALNDVLARPLRRTLTVAMWVSVPLAFLVYGLLLWQGSSVGIVVAWFVLVLAFTHRHVVPVRPGWLCHLSLAHLLIGWSLASSKLWDMGLFLQPEALAWALGGCLVLAVPALGLERAASPLWLAYARGAWPWLSATAFAFGALALAWTLDQAVPGTVSGQSAVSPVLYPGLAWLMFELAARRWRVGVFELLKAACCVWFVSMFQFQYPYPPAQEAATLLATLLFATVLFVALEGAWAGLESVLGARLRTTPFGPRQPARERRVLAALVSALLVATLALHLGLVAVGEGPIEHAWLYGFIPLGAWAYTTLRSQALLILNVALLAYTTCHLALALLPQVQVHDLTAMHLLSGALVASMFCYVALAAWLRRRYTP